MTFYSHYKKNLLKFVTHFPKTLHIYILNSICLGYIFAIQNPQWQIDVWAYAPPPVVGIGLAERASVEVPNLTVRNFVVRGRNQIFFIFFFIFLF